MLELSAIRWCRENLPEKMGWRCLRETAAFTSSNAQAHTNDGYYSQVMCGCGYTYCSIISSVQGRPSVVRSTRVRPYKVYVKLRLAVSSSLSMSRPSRSIASLIGRPLPNLSSTINARSRQDHFPLPGPLCINKLQASSRSRVRSKNSSANASIVMYVEH